MTVCIAGISYSNPQPFILAACDRKLSFFGGWISAEGIATKLSGLNKDWTVMFAGPTSPMVALIDGIRERVEKLRPTNFRPFARICRDVYRAERKLLIESEVLGNYDIDNYAEYAAMRKTDPSFHSEVSKKITEVEQEWNLLFAGFDRRRRPHLFTITENGAIGFYDAVGYAAIGSGALRALLALSSYPFEKALPLSMAIFGLVAAKFAAESTEGVGEQTVLTVLEPRTERSPAFNDITIKSLRHMWKALPRFAGQDATAAIWKELVNFQNLGWLSENKPLKPSSAERLAPEP